MSVGCSAGCTSLPFQQLLQACSSPQSEAQAGRKQEKWLLPHDLPLKSTDEGPAQLVDKRTGPAALSTYQPLTPLACSTG